ncbi:MAG TPA: NADH-quinone oxidoreductase subunit M [Verrucomicrobiae bacterium]|nr:NADH-quinone oxidoreductase subunit M [Verrucomicrobiae bacterium]
MEPAIASPSGPSWPWLTCLILSPILGAVIVAGMDRNRRTLAWGVGLLSMLVTLGLALAIWFQFDPARGEVQLVERHAWIPSVNVEYHLGVDGLSALMVMLAALIVPFALLAEWKRLGDPAAGAGDLARPGTPAFVALLLFLQAGMLGSFTALNFVHWFLFWELSLVPAYFLIKLWGGARRSAAANQFFVYTMVGSVTLLLSMLAVYLVTGSFDLIALAEKGRTGELASLFSLKLKWYGLSMRTLALVIFGGALLGFAVKVPLVPFHTWLPATYSEAPTGVSMVLTGVMSKMGVYGFLRILLPIFPEQMRWVLTPLLWLAVATVVLSACAAFAQRDLKRIVAYSSINHLGYCLLGIFAVARFVDSNPQWTTEKAAVLNGVLLQMFNHGLTASALFYFVGLIEQRTGRRGLEDFGGLRQVAPVFCGLMGIALFASLGLPGLNGFIGEFLIFKGVFPLVTWAAAFSTLGLLVTAVFILTIMQKVWSGPLETRWSQFLDLTLSERLVVIPALALMLVLGLWPQLVLGRINSTVLQMVEGLKL